MPSDESASPPARNSAAFIVKILIVMLAIFLAGTGLRLYSPPTFQSSGHDEKLYEQYTQFFLKNGLTAYPSLVEYYTTDPLFTQETQLPPTRFLYIFSGYCWAKVTGQTAINSLHAISCLFSILTMPLAAFFAYRLGGARSALGVLALIACSPMQIYVSRHALIDGFFAFWALLSIWLLWENLQKPTKAGWLVAFTVSIALVVLIKENAFFVFVAILGILGVNRWAKFGTVTRPLVLCTFTGALLGAVGIAILSGGMDYAIKTYVILVRSASHLDYAIQTGDGPWYRYICELLLMSPVVLLLSVGSVFRFTRETRQQWFLFSFVAFSYLVMCNVKYGMNLRYTNMWDMPMRYLAFWHLAVLCEYLPKRKNCILIACVIAICAYDLAQYHLFFVKYRIYEPIPHALLRAVKIFVPSPG